MPEGGTITVGMGNHTLDEGSANQHDLPPGDYISLSVKDTGTGMAPEVLAHVFEPFFTTKPTGRGTGLGLSMIYGFAKQSNGQIQVHSEVGKGTMICLYLPRFTSEAGVDSRQSIL
jgi:signal transduction histidine kinase